MTIKAIILPYVNMVRVTRRLGRYMPSSNYNAPYYSSSIDQQITKWGQDIKERISGNFYNSYVSYSEEPKEIGINSSRHVYYMIHGVIDGVIQNAVIKRQSVGWGVVFYQYSMFTKKEDVDLIKSDIRKTIIEEPSMIGNIMNAFNDPTIPHIYAKILKMCTTPSLALGTRHLVIKQKIDALNVIMAKGLKKSERAIDKLEDILNEESM